MNEKIATVLEVGVLQLQQWHLSVSFRDGAAFSADINQLHQNQ